MTKYSIVASWTTVCHRTKSLVRIQFQPAPRPADRRPGRARISRNRRLSLTSPRSLSKPPTVAPVSKPTSNRPKPPRSRFRRWNPESTVNRVPSREATAATFRQIRSKRAPSEETVASSRETPSTEESFDSARRRGWCCPQKKEFSHFWQLQRAETPANPKKGGERRHFSDAFRPDPAKTAPQKSHKDGFGLVVGMMRQKHRRTGVVQQEGPIATVSVGPGRGFVSHTARWGWKLPQRKVHTDAPLPHRRPFERPFALGPPAVIDVQDAQSFGPGQTAQCPQQDSGISSPGKANSPGLERHPKFQRRTESLKQGGRRVG